MSIRISVVNIFRCFIHKIEDNTMKFCLLRKLWETMDVMMKSFKADCLPNLASPQIMAAEVVELNYSSFSPITVIREMKGRHPEQKRLTKLQVNRIPKRFEQHGNLPSEISGNVEMS